MNIIFVINDYTFNIKIESVISVVSLNELLVLSNFNVMVTLTNTANYSLVECID